MPHTSSSSWAKHWGIWFYYFEDKWHRCIKGAFNTSSEWNDHHFADDIFIYLNENCCFFYSRLTEVIFLGFNFSTAALVQIMYCRLFGASNYACNGIINYVIHWWACLLTQICVIQPRWVNMALMGLALLYRCYFSQITAGHAKIGYL